MSIWQYTRGAELPSITIEALDADGLPIDFSTGWTFQVKVGEPGKTALVTTTSVVGAATKPNLTISFAAGVLDPLTIGVTYTVQVACTNGTGQARIYATQLRVVDAVL